jgi:hypothetical protein
MKLSKEYPATHSMSTAWYCVDEEGNVGIFDIDDNGPVPVGGYEQNCVNEVFWDYFSSEEDGDFRFLNLSQEQILSMLEPYDDKGEWKKDQFGWANIAWMDVIIKIDMSKIDIFKQAVSLIKKNELPPICISKELGLFYVDLYFYENKKVVDILENNHVVLAKYEAPYYETLFDDDDDEEKERIEKNIQKFPMFIYHQDYAVSRYPAIRVRNPRHPLKIEQLPKKIQERIKKVPVRFKDCDRIQLAELIPVDSIWSFEYVYNKRIWWQLASSDGGKMFYNEATHSIIQGDEMDKLIADGKAEERDYHKHYELEDEEDG